jgi:DNA-binding response OmpR family regulator
MIELLQERPGAGLPLQGPEDGRPGTGTRTRMTRVLVAGEHADAAAPTAAGERLQLTPTEWAILEQLLQHAGQLVDGARLMTSVWGPGFEHCTNYLRFHMTRLRRKLEDNPAHPCHLLTEHGMGYRYQPRGR